jgi:hypothetical protein
MPLIATVSRCFSTFSTPFASRTSRQLAGVVAGLAVLLLGSSLARADEAGYSPATRYTTPAFKLGLQTGLQYWSEHGPFGTNTGAAQGLAVGYTVGARASAEFLPWLALDVRGTLSHNEAFPQAGGGSLFTPGILGALRFTAPLDYVQPYALVGGGYYHHTASGSGTALLSGGEPAVVAGLGFAVPVGQKVEIGVEYTFSFLVGESLSSNDAFEGGDPSTMSLFVQYRVGQ